MPQTGLPRRNMQYDMEFTDSYKTPYDHDKVENDARGYVIDARSVEPGVNAVGDAYLLTGTPSGTNWTPDADAVAGAIAVYMNLNAPLADPWGYFAPREGIFLFDLTTNFERVYTGAAWLDNARWTRRPGSRIVTDANVTLVPQDDSGVVTLTSLTAGRQVLLPSSLYDGFKTTVGNRDATNTVAFETAGKTWRGGAGGSGEPAALGENNFALVQQVAADEWVVLQEV